jgi:predicted nucleotidyltransferase
MKITKAPRLSRIGGCIRRVAPPQLRRAWVFGSTVKGFGKATSDVDILVDVAPEFSLLDAAGLKISLEEKLMRKVDLVSRKYLHPELRDEIEATKVLVYEKHPFSCARNKSHVQDALEKKKKAPSSNRFLQCREIGAEKL